MSEDNELKVLRVLALAIDNDTPDHRIEYLLKKLYGLDGMSLDVFNTKLYLRILKVRDKLGVKDGK